MFEYLIVVGLFRTMGFERLNHLIDCLALGALIVLLISYTLSKILRSSLPGAVIKYTPELIEDNLQTCLIEELAALDWTKDEVTIGKNQYKLGRATQVFGDKEILQKKPPAIWGNTRQIHPWTPSMLRVK